jgi:DUF917 family protein
VVDLFPLPTILVGKISQQTWDIMHPELRSETERMAKELTAGMAKYAEGAARDADLAEYHELAAAGGTTLAEALARFVNLENAIKADPVQGVALVLKNLGINPEYWARQLLEADAA